ncbi:MAG: hypothetical protein QOH90_233 [Actinomycetota bacterium]|nr:hypothetical protein [Actinomycetota bacterium]
MYRLSMSKSNIRALFAAMLVVLQLAGVASADSTTVDDPRGDANRAREDIDYAIADHHKGLLRHSVTMYGAFETYHPRICILIQTPKAGYRVCGPQVWRVRDDQPIGSAKVRRPNDHTIAFSFTKAVIGRPNSYHWYVSVGSNAPFCPDPPCDITRNVVHQL